tara:strand:- start:758 stop:1288 length:531 start_codon:yes stop_codon:yes gene_type:complete
MNKKQFSIDEVQLIGSLVRDYQTLVPAIAKAATREGDEVEQLQARILEVLKALRLGPTGSIATDNENTVKGIETEVGDEFDKVLEYILKKTGLETKDYPEHGMTKKDMNEIWQLITASHDYANERIEQLCTMVIELSEEVDILRRDNEERVAKLLADCPVDDPQNPAWTRLFASLP